MNTHTKTIIVIAILVLALGGIIWSVYSIYFVDMRTPEEKSIDAAVQALIDDGTLTDDTPEQVWLKKDAVDNPKRPFTTRAQLGDDIDSIGVLTIEKIGVSCQVYDSENTMEDMKKGASHYRSTSYWDGNIGFAAHIGNASYCYFNRLHELKTGDIIEYETTLGTRHYAVETVKAISDEDWDYLGRTDDNRVTLTTCVDGRENVRLCVQAVEIVDT